MSDHRDPMMLTLEALRSDIERTPLADSLTVRRRGDQRTRRAAVGSAVAVVALVAGVVGVAGGLTGDNRATDNPPATGGPTVDMTPEPGPTTMDPPVTEVPDRVLLTTEDLGLDRLTRENVNAAGIETLTGGCLLGSDDLVDFGFAAFGPDPDGEPTVSQSVITQEDADGATRQLAGFRADMEACQERQVEMPGPESAASRLPLQPATMGALGEDAWLFVVEATDLRTYVFGFRSANASGIMAFDAGIDIERATDLAVEARTRMTETYGA